MANSNTTTVYTKFMTSALEVMDRPMITPMDPKIILTTMNVGSNSSRFVTKRRKPAAFIPCESRERRKGTLRQEKERTTKNERMMSCLSEERSAMCVP